MEKKCGRCKHIKPHDSFTKDNSRPLGLSNNCKECDKDRRSKAHNKNPDKRKTYKLKHLFGITLEQKMEILAKQNSVCAICKGQKPSSPEGWNLDHSHKSGKIRGVLCGNCNHGLGFFKDSKENLLSAILYLERTS